MAEYYIGANDEHGINPPTIGKRTPIMPYLNRAIYENEFNYPTKNFFIQACLRQNFDTYDVKPERNDISITTRVRRVNSQNLTLLVTFAYNAFGSGNTFNSASGVITFYSDQNRFVTRSRALSEDIYDRLTNGNFRAGMGIGILDVGMLSSVNCPATLIEAGFMTNFEEAKLMLNPDYQIDIAEKTCQGVCDYLDVNYINRTDLNNYPLLRQGNRGNYVKLLQSLLNTAGIDLSIDGIFGQDTLTAVRGFQNGNGLVADGIVGNQTWKTLLWLPPYPVLRRGSRGNYVLYLQQLLLSKLYDVGEIDGIFGSRTQAAVTQFQRENGLVVDGVVGSRTWNTIKISSGRKLN